jgi:hypothetical protein
VYVPQTVKPTAVLFENVRIFDGKSDRRAPAQNVLVVDNVIMTISASSRKGTGRPAAG